MAAPGTSKQAAAPGSKLQSLDREGLIKVLKKQAEQKRELGEEITKLKKERDEALAKIAATPSKPRQENGHANATAAIDDVRKKYEAQLAKTKTLSMELADYDKQISALKEEKASLAGKLEKVLIEHEELQEQFSITQEQLDITKQHNIDLEKGLEISRTAVDELRHQKDDAESAKNEMQKMKITESSDSEKRVLALTEELAKATRDVEVMRMALKSVKAQREETTKDLRQFATLYDETVKEFEEYKKRTRAVYEGAAKNVVPPSPESLTEGTYDEVVTKLHKLSEELETLRKEKEETADKIIRLSQRADRAEHDSHKFKEEAAQYHAEVNTLLDDARLMRERYDESLRQEKNQMREALDRMKISRQQDIEKMNTEKEMIALRAEQAENKRLAELDAIRRERDELQRQLDHITRNAPSSTIPPSPTIPAHRNETPTVTPALHNTYSSALSTDSPLRDTPEPPTEVSLEDIIFGNDIVEGPPSTIDDYGASVSTMKEALKVAEQQNTSLRELLAESESNNELFSDQIAVLKEEIRRIQRNSEREIHVNNTEYLKNIILQFMRPEKVNGEKRQLVPIIRTMLQLSDEEYKNVLDMTTEATTEEASSVSTLSSLFHRWNGLS